MLKIAAQEALAEATVLDVLLLLQVWELRWVVAT